MYLRIEHKNQWDPYTVFRARRNTFFLVNLVENQNEPKRPESVGRLGSVGGRIMVFIRDVGCGSLKSKTLIPSRRL